MVDDWWHTHPERAAPLLGGGIPLGRGSRTLKAIIVLLLIRAIAATAFELADAEDADAEDAEAEAEAEADVKLPFVSIVKAW
jgi:hypothetical protein